MSSSRPHSGKGRLQSKGDGQIIQCETKVKLARLPAQLRTSSRPTLQLEVLSGRNVRLRWQREMMELNPVYRALGECVWLLCFGERLWLSLPPLVSLYLVAGRGGESSGCAFSRTVASV